MTYNIYTCFLIFLFLCVCCGNPSIFSKITNFNKVLNQSDKKESLNCTMWLIEFASLHHSHWAVMWNLHGTNIEISQVDDLLCAVAENYCPSMWGEHKLSVSEEMRVLFDILPKSSYFFNVSPYRGIAFCYLSAYVFPFWLIMDFIIYYKTNVILSKLGWAGSEGCFSLFFVCRSNIIISYSQTNCK